MHVITDFLACMPVFYSDSAGTLIIATNQYDIGKKGRVSEVACLEYLTYGYLPFQASLYDGVDRLGPGQVLSVRFAERNSLSISDESYPVYVPLDERLTDIDRVCELLDERFSRYFSRLAPSSSVAGLSGGYDSRLIAAYTADRGTEFVTFGNPGTKEAAVAQQVVDVLGASTTMFDIPPDAPARFIDDFILGMQTLDNLEMSHVFAMLDVLRGFGRDFAIDGFLGGEVVGSHYYFKLSGGSESVSSVLLMRDRYQQQVRDPEAYVERLRGLYGRSIDLGSHNESSREYIRQMTEEQVRNCYSDADMVELLSYRLRTRCVIACGPVTFMRRLPTLCPFYDRSLFDLALSIDKSLRAGDRLYNAFWRSRFPDLAGVPKESTGGSAKQSDTAYRWGSLANSLIRRVRKWTPALSSKKSNKAGGDLDEFIGAYCGSESNAEVLQLAYSTFQDIIPLNLDSQRRSEENINRLRLRAASLALLLE
jgi:hypothetical protein